MTTQNEAVNVEIVCTIGLDREVYAQEETKEIDGVRKKKKPMQWLFIFQKDESSWLVATEC